MYRVLSALRRDMNEGWVWIGKKWSQPRTVVRIKNKTNGKKIYFECLEIDNNYLMEYNKPYRYQIDNNAIGFTIVMNSWYRRNLGDLETSKEYDLEIGKFDNFWGWLRVCLGHPQIVVKISTWLAIIAVVLGLLSIVK